MSRNSNPGIIFSNSSACWTISHSRRLYNTTKFPSDFVPYSVFFPLVPCFTPFKFSSFFSHCFPTHLHIFKSKHLSKLKNINHFHLQSNYAFTSFPRTDGLGFLIANTRLLLPIIPAPVSPFSTHIPRSWQNKYLQIFPRYCAPLCLDIC